MSERTIVIGVDDSARSVDAITFGGRLAAATDANVIVACAFGADQSPGYAALRDAALDTAHAMSKRLEGVAPNRISIRAPAGVPAQALLHLASVELASLIVVGSTHTGRLGRVVPGATGEKLVSGAPCPVAVVPRGYAGRAFRRIGIAYDGSEEAKAALAAAAALARTLRAELELIGVAASDWYTGPHRHAKLRAGVDDEVLEGLRAAAAGLTVAAATALRSGDPAEELSDHSAGLDLLVTGSRGYPPLRSVVAGGVSGRVIRSSHCPVIVMAPGATGDLIGSA